MLANSLFFTGLGLAFLALLDLFTSDHQKKAVNDLVFRAWNALDDLKRVSFADLIKKSPSFSTVLGLLSALAVLLIGCYLVYATWKGRLLLPILMAGLMLPTIFGFVAAALTFAENVQESTYRQIYIIRPLIFLLLTIGLVTAWYFIENIIVRHIFLLYAFVSAVMLVLHSLIILPLILAHCASGILWTGEFIVRRVAEYPKGPLLAVSALLAAIAAVLKLFAG